MHYSVILLNDDDVPKILTRDFHIVYVSNFYIVYSSDAINIFYWWF